MLGLTQAQGIILAIGGAIFVLVAGAVLVLRGRHVESGADIPNAMRPGPSDPDLETPLLHKLQGWGVLLVLFFVIWVPAVWLLEPSNNLEQEEALLDGVDPARAATRSSCSRRRTRRASDACSATAPSSRVRAS